MTTPSRRRVAVFTGTRAEYGLLVPILRRLQQSDATELSLIVAGSHLSLLHGMTVDAVEADGFVVDERIEMVLAADSTTAVTKSIGLCMIDMAGALDRQKPDLLLVLGDRFEVLAAATAALIAGIPVAHLHGGEITEGAFDDSIRHAVTKLSHLHFVATDEFGRRVRQLGESPDRIHVVGAPALDVISSLAPMSLAELSASMSFELTSPTVLVVYHPSTIPGEDPVATVDAILSAVDRSGAGSIVASLPNADPKFNAVRTRIEQFAAQRDNVIAVASLGHERYLSLLRNVAVIVGNSSSGVIEAPALGTPTVNVGQRQIGRPMAGSIAQVEPDGEAIEAAVRSVLAGTTHHEPGSPYDRGVSVALSVIKVIEESDLPSLLKKSFADTDPSVAAR